MRIHLAAPGLLLASLCAVAVAAADTPANMATLHQRDCGGCHIQLTGGDGSVIYTRKDRKATDMSKLQQQVDRFVSELELDWSSEQRTAMTHYLDTTYYHFPPSP